jgi:hypothetical protein
MPRGNQKGSSKAPAKPAEDDKKKEEKKNIENVATDDGKGGNGKGKNKGKK